MAGPAPALATRSVDLTTVTAFPVNPNVTWPWAPRETSYVHLGADTPVDISLDGVNVHASIFPGTAQAGLVIHAPQPGVWLRASVPGGVGVIVVCTAEGT